MVDKWFSHDNGKQCWQGIMLGTKGLYLLVILENSKPLQIPKKHATTAVATKILFRYIETVVSTNKLVESGQSKRNQHSHKEVVEGG